MEIKPAVVLSTHTMGLGVIRALGMMGVPVVAYYYNEKDMGYESKYITQRIRVPHPEHGEELFVATLVAQASQFGGGLLIPASDETLTTVSRHKELLDDYYTVACTEWEITKRFIEKRHTYALAEAHGVPAPKTVVPHSRDEAAAYAEAATFPCLVKPSESHLYYEVFNTKMVRVTNVDELLKAYQEAADRGFEVMVQELIPGDDACGVNYNAYFWDGQPLVEFTAQQLRNAPPEFGSPRVVMSKHIPEVLESGRKILRAMGFYGYACTEFKRDPRDGIYKLMEVNGRHNRSLLLSVRCGLNFPWLQYRHLMQGEVPVATDYPEGVYWIALMEDLFNSVKYRKVEGYPLSEYVRPYLGPHIFSVFDRRDLRPSLRRVLELVGRSLRGTVSTDSRASKAQKV
jgi:D-aspartate ligase